jgi:hypothetical protein
MKLIQFVWYNEDLRREIFSYLRKEAKVKCDQCNDVCVWDKKKLKIYHEEKYKDGIISIKCYKCYWTNMIDLCCIS